MPRSRTMTKAEVRQRAGMARESLQVALERLEMMRDESEPSAEAQVAASNAVTAAVAAADALCGAALGERSADQDHRTAADLLARVDLGPDVPALAPRLRRLLSSKTTLQYGGYCTGAVARRATADAQVIVDALWRLRL